MLPNPKSSNFRTALRAARKEAGMTLSELAAAAGISNVMPGRYERGESQPTMGTWQELNKVLFEVDDEEIEAEAKKQEIGDSLTESTLEEILEELKSRGFKTISLSYS
ncbi:helix-turn-helix domain-containing protein [Pseudomonas sp. JS3066]|uniref:helix-turn-helix domain-containing protein n=1 Tax=Pseudomonas sp. JS3066 TaxID=3090665 RepID=UPI002E7C3FAA|nr:helix-turn-helix domain-containing protein [Pseudomonas sp. JS3066]WVK90891.1 helix-turn-helix domain-containing protein [Pseudomonas sp. JS3066]